MKKSTKFLMILFLVALLLSSCGKSESLCKQIDSVHNSSYVAFLESDTKVTQVNMNPDDFGFIDNCLDSVGSKRLIYNNLSVHSGSPMENIKSEKAEITIIEKSDKKGTITYNDNTSLLVVLSIVCVIVIFSLSLFMFLLYRDRSYKANPPRYSDTAVTIDVRPMQRRRKNTNNQQFATTKAVLPKIKLPEMQSEVIKGTIVIETGSLAGYELSLKEGETLNFGKDATRCNVIFPSDYLYVSRLHCSVLFSKGNYFVTDLSSNGVFCGDIKLEKNQSVPIAPNTRIHLANKTCLLLLK